MTDLKEQLIRLGHQNPSLRRHLKPILDAVGKTSSLVDTTGLRKFAMSADDLITWMRESLAPAGDYAGLTHKEGPMMSNISSGNIDLVFMINTKKFRKDFSRFNHVAQTLTLSIQRGSREGDPLKVTVFSGDGESHRGVKAGEFEIPTDKEPDEVGILRHAYGILRNNAGNL